MKRSLTTALQAWRASELRKPLVLRGARQVGKTHLLTEFGQTAFRALHVLNFQSDPAAASLFEGNLTPARLLQRIELYLDVDIDISEDLLFLDEIQDCPRALTSLKFFAEQLPQLAVASAGSLLGVVHSESAFPVGKVSFLDLRPLSFYEFLDAVGQARTLAYLQELTLGEAIPDAIHEQLTHWVRCYTVVGGMPASVLAFVAGGALHRGFDGARTVQRDLLDAYTRDFAKYTDHRRTDRIQQVFEHIPAMLSRESRKFVPSAIRKGSRHATYESAIDWLVNAGLVHRVSICNSGELPFAAHTRSNRFKLYLVDVGLLGALADLSPAALYELSPDSGFRTFRGPTTENLVAQEFLAQGVVRRLFSWATNTAELEFLVEHEGRVLPVEVKAGRSGKLKSLTSFADRYPDATAFRTRLSARPFQVRGDMHSYPFYLAGRFPMSET